MKDSLQAGVRLPKSLWIRTSRVKDIPTNQIPKGQNKYLSCWLDHNWPPADVLSLTYQSGNCCVSWQLSGVSHDRMWPLVFLRHENFLPNKRFGLKIDLRFRDSHKTPYSTRMKPQYFSSCPQMTQVSLWLDCWWSSGGKKWKWLDSGAWDQKEESLGGGLAVFVLDSGFAKC